MSRRWLLIPRILPLAVLALAIVAVPVLIFSPEGLARLRHLEGERARVDEDVSKLSAEIRRLRAEVARIQKDPAMVERVARDELGLVRKTEVVFQFED